MCRPNALTVGFLRRFGLKTGIGFAHFDLESGMVFEETKGCVWAYLSFQFQLNTKLKSDMRISNGIKKTFLLAFYNFCLWGLKTGVENKILGGLK